MLSLKELRRAWRARALAARVLPLGLRAPAEPAPPLPPFREDPLAPLALPPPLNIPSAPPQRVLVAGVYLADRENTAAHIIERFAVSGTHTVTQRWIALSLGGGGRTDLPHTQRVQAGPSPRFALLNELIGPPNEFDWVIICDDDVELCDGFVDRLLAIAAHADLALCQPARTAGSYIDIPLMRQAQGLLARRTRYVEIGPMVCIRRDAFEHILPFAATNDMGWGLDFVWPARLEKAGLRLGVIDAAPIAHRIRPTKVTYSRAAAEAAMQGLLEREPHLSRAEAFTVLETYAA